MSTAKDDLTRLIQEQPEDSSQDEIVRELAFHVMVQRGIADSDARARWVTKNCSIASARGRDKLDRRTS